MEDLLGALMQGGQEPTEPEDAGPEEDPLAQVIQAMMADQTPPGQAAHTEAPPGQAEVDMGGLLQGLLGGSGGLPGAAGQTPEEYAVQPGTGAMPSEMDLGGLLQGLLGGTGGPGGSTAPAPASGGGGLGEILGAVMDGGSSTMESSSLLAPIVNGLAEKLGLPPQIAQAVVAFVLGKLIGRRLQPGVDSSRAAAGSGAAESRQPNLEDVVQKMNRGERVTKAAIRDAGLAQELAQQTGLDRTQAEASLQEVLNALGEQLSTAK